MNRTIQERALDAALDGLRILDGFSGVTSDSDTVLYPSEERLAADLSQVGYNMPTSGMYTLEEFLERVGTTRNAGLSMSIEQLAALLLDLVSQATLWVADAELDMATVGAIIQRFARHIAEQA